MPIAINLDEDLLHRLPLPLAQLYRRAHNAKMPQERHHAAYYLWEAALKLLGSVAVVEYAELGDPEPELAERLQNLARPSLGHWWEFVRRLVSVLADRGDRGFVSVRDLLLGRSRDDLPHAAGLDGVLVEVLEGREAAGSRTRVRLTELFDRLVRYRNREFGHGATGQKPVAFYDRVGRALLAGVAEVLGPLDTLAGRRLLYVADVCRHASGRWLVERYELRGEASRRLESLDLPDREAICWLLPQRVYLETIAFGPSCLESGDRSPGPGEKVENVGQRASDPGPRAVSLHPLLRYEADSGEVLFLNARRGRQRMEYLSYSTGRVLERADLAQEQCELLARVLHVPVGAPSVADWATRSQVEEQADGVPEEQPAASRQLGEFELLSELGRGGMGVVYRAWQPSLGRQVAVKKLYRTGDPKAEARFAREIRALGHVEHPNVVKIFTSGNDGDQWFYAMELVEGAPLAAVCEKLQSRSSHPETVDLQTWQQAVSTVCTEARQAEKPLSDTSVIGAETPSPTMTAPGRNAPRSPLRVGRSYVRHVVELVRQVAEAAHALHERGILHRDIKPGNVMVMADSNQVVLMDLGLAQIADEVEGRLTKTRQFIGTLRYASPEQVLAVGGLDRRSDVYNLGATLWELLTLRPMFSATDQTPTPELMRRIQVEEPERPRKYHPGLSRDLEAIVLKCLEKDGARRYATARELVRDLERYQAGKPVLARPVGNLQRTWRWCRRNPAWASMVAILALVIIGSMGGLYALYLHADQARQNADEQRKMAEDKEKRERTISKFYKDYVLAAPRPMGYEGGASTQIKLWQALDRAVPKIDEAFAGQPELEAEVRHTLGVTYFYLGRYQAARTQGEKAYKIRLELLGPDHPDTIRSGFELAEHYYRLGKLDESERLYRDIIESGHRVLGPEDEDILYAPLRLGSVLFSKGQTAEAETLLRLGIDACKLTLGADHHHTFCGQVRLSNVLEAKGKSEEALALQRQTFEGRCRVLGADGYDTLLSMGEVGSLLRQQGKLAEAEPILRRNLEARSRVLGREHNDTLYAKHQVAFLLEAQGKLPEAEQLHREALEVWQRAYGLEDLDTLTCQANLASNLEQQGKLAEAEKLYGQTLETRRRVLGPENTNTLDSMYLMANFWVSQKKFAEAEKLYRQLIAANTRVFGPEHGATLGRQEDLANVLEKQGQIDQAEKLYRQTLETRQRVLPPEHTQILLTKDNLATLLENQARLDEAAKLLREVLAVKRKTLAADDVDLAYSLAVLGGVLTKNGQAAEAEPLLRECLTIRTKQLPSGHWQIASAQSLLGDCLARQKQFADAERLLLPGCEGLTKAKDAPAEVVAKAFDRVIELYEKWGKSEQAETWRKKRSASGK